MIAHCPLMDRQPRGDRKSVEPRSSNPGINQTCAQVRPEPQRRGFIPPFRLVLLGCVMMVPINNLVLPFQGYRYGGDVVRSKAAFLSQEINSTIIYLGIESRRNKGGRRGHWTFDVEFPRLTTAERCIQHRSQHDVQDRTQCGPDFRGSGGEVHMQTRN